jgi:hypothetical protein
MRTRKQISSLNVSDRQRISTMLRTEFFRRTGLLLPLRRRLESVPVGGSYDGAAGKIVAQIG